jgi:hypothetical protein
VSGTKSVFASDDPHEPPFGGLPTPSGERPGEVSIEALGRFAAARLAHAGFAPYTPETVALATSMLRASAVMADSWRRQHAEFQRQVDELAGKPTPPT